MMIVGQMGSQAGINVEGHTRDNTMFAIEQ